MSGRVPVSEAGHVPVARLARGGARRQTRVWAALFLAGVASGLMIVYLCSFCCAPGKRAVDPDTQASEAHDLPLNVEMMRQRIQEQRAVQAAGVRDLPNPIATADRAPREKNSAARTYRLIAELSPDTVPAKVESAEEAANHPFTVYGLTRNPLKAETGTYTPGYPSSKGGFIQASITVSGKEKHLASFEWILYQPATGTVCHLYRPPGSQAIRLPQTVTYAPGLNKVEFPELGALPSPLLEAFGALGCLELGLYAGAAPAQDKEPFFWREKLKLTDGSVTIPPESRQAFKAYSERIENSNNPLLNDCCVKRKALADKRQELKAFEAASTDADEELKRAADAVRSRTDAGTRAEQEIERLDAEAKSERDFINELGRKQQTAKSKTVASTLQQAIADEATAQTTEERVKQKRFIARLTERAAKYVDIQSELYNNSKDEKIRSRLDAIKKHEFACVEIKMLSEARLREISDNRAIQERHQVAGKTQAQGMKAQSESGLKQAQAAADDYHAKLKALPAEVDKLENELNQALAKLEAGLTVTATVIIDKPSNTRGSP
jgi:hypothetical protein